MVENLLTLVASIEDLRQLASELRLFAVVDACDSPAIQFKIAELGPTDTLCLYRGEVAPEILEIAPYLIKVDEGLLEWMVETIWDEPWGIFIVSKSNTTTLLRHLRKFLLVQGEDGTSLYFRYYDPRVLLTFLPSCTPAELGTFFGPINAYGVMDYQNHHIIVYHLRNL